MANAKVTLNETTLMDVTGTTVDADHLLEGTTAIGPDGELVVGTASGGGDTLAALLSNELTEYSYNGTSIQPYMFRDRTNLESIELPNVATIPSYAFRGCSSLNDVDISSATSIGEYAFSNCVALDEISLPSVTTINNYAFDGCTALSSISSDTVTSVGLSTNNYGRSFQSCTSLQSVSFPNATYIADRTFISCSNLVSVNFPNLLTCGRAGTDAHIFDGCKKLQLLHLPKLTNAYGVGAFWGIGSSTSYVTIVLPAITGVVSSFRQSYCEAVDIGPGFAGPLDAYNFYSGTYRNIILRNPDAVVTCTAANSIYSINSSTKVFVPSSLVTAYKEATNWSTKGDIFYSIEGSIYENAYADGTPIS